ncbi:Dabb family protein [Shimia marina]|uniref:Stress responsive A/B Barrel Domain protein n=1 Tax=Shimia marina TaxID=321267 RepID=A0A0P1EPK5_9RHOB|nr:Dabb family protein [Shimia marina]CUH52046.1 Stress responsive A/B Barrel Domain protein [Shimia marina]SFE61128.1 Stress responsive A/B Barrel Domain [Shimia marina]
MIKHIVLTRFRADVSEATITEIYAGLARVTERLEGATGFHGGRSTSPEKIERGYMHGFSIDFDSFDDLATYSADAEHKRWGAEIVAHAEGGLDGVLVLDIEA